ncbi:hypothetical protein GAYE_SCF46G5782 [Galdieria yellowstonensis]|nr:hypothetical protein GAYE_SCF46G5782 [Galdieria yellowstonensis]
MSDVPLGPNVGEWSVEALISGTLYVFLDLRKALVRGGNFQDVLLSGFAKKAVSGLPNSSKLLSKVLKSFDEPKGWIEKLFEVTNKRYLFLFIDEIGYLSTDMFKRFSDLYTKDQKGTNVFRLFFRILSAILSDPPIICVVAGRTESISKRIG